MKEIFDNYVEHSFGQLSQSPEKRQQFDHNYRRLLPADLTKAKLLDIGIGRGEMLSCLQSWGALDFLGLDISPSTVAFCQSLGLPCVCVDDSQAYLLQHSQTYDAITLLDVLEHIPKPQMVDFLKALKASLKPGGVLIIQVPNLQAPDGHLHRYNDITHEVGFVEHSLAQVLLAADFKRFSFHGFEAFVQGGFKEGIKKCLRSLHWRWIRFWRNVHANLNPKVLHPVMYAVVRKD